MSRFVRLTELPNWRRISLYAWDAPRDPTAYGLLDLDVTAALAYLAQLGERTGIKVTLTHLVGRAIADAIAARPEVNAVVRRRHAIYQRQTIDVFFQVSYGGGEDLSGAKVSDANRKPVEAIAQELQRRAERVRTRGDGNLTSSSALLARLPGPVRGALLKANEFVQYDLGADLGPLGLPGDAYGSVMVTNVGVFGLPKGLAPLVPFSRAPLVLTVGAVEQRPWVVGDAVVPRPVLTIGAALDHRLLDGFQAGQITARFQEIMADPQAHL